MEQKKKHYVIGRPIDGISLNGLEYLMKPEGGLMFFGSARAAHDYLVQSGHTDTDIDGMVIQCIEEDWPCQR